MRTARFSTFVFHFLRVSSNPNAVAALTLFVAGLAIIPPAVAATPAETFGASTKGSTSVVDHSPWDRLLKAYVASGSDGVTRVDYARFKSISHQDLKTYIGALQGVDVASLDRPEQFAFWANLYNAKTIDIVLDKYPVKSIKDIRLGGGVVAAVTGGPWKAKVLKIGATELSLDDIEHGILRPLFKDARVHYAVNCASYGCPNLGYEAFTGKKLDAQLDAAARAYVNSPRGARFDGEKLIVSSIYSWFEDDFGGSEAGVLEHLKRYAEPALKRKLESITEIGDYGYDWLLNDIAR
jgi:hypothetical protein